MFLPLDGAELTLPVMLLTEDADWGELYLPSVTEIYRANLFLLLNGNRKMISRLQTEIFLKQGIDIKPHYSYCFYLHQVH